MKYKLKTKIVYNNMLLNANLYTETIKMFVVVFSNDKVTVMLHSSFMFK